MTLKSGILVVTILTNLAAIRVAEKYPTVLDSICFTSHAIIQIKTIYTLHTSIGVTIEYVTVFYSIFFALVIVFVGTTHTTQAGV